VGIRSRERMEAVTARRQRRAPRAGIAAAVPVMSEVHGRAAESRGGAERPQLAMLPILACVPDTALAGRFNHAEQLRPDSVGTRPGTTTAWANVGVAAQPDTCSPKSWHLGYVTSAVPTDLGFGSDAFRTVRTLGGAGRREASDDQDADPAQKQTKQEAVFRSLRLIVTRGAGES
jgi:hypothetical protein